MNTIKYTPVPLPDVEFRYIDSTLVLISCVGNKGFIKKIHITHSDEWFVTIYWEGGNESYDSIKSMGNVIAMVPYRGATEKRLNYYRKQSDAIDDYIANMQ